MRKIFKSKKEAEKFNDANRYGLYPHKNHATWDEEWALSSHSGNCNCGMCPTLRDDGFVR